MFDDSRSFISRAYLQSTLDIEFKAYVVEGTDTKVLDALKAWDGRAALSETQAESAFIQTFFVDLWGYGQSGRVDARDVSAIPKFPVAGAGASGGAGEADLALGWFKEGPNSQAQVLCEFKDIRSGLDVKQNRKGANQTPVEQCLNYVRHARRNLFGNEPVQPWWGLVTDMNEFRLYWWDRAPQQYMRFVIRGRRDLFEKHDLLTDDPQAQFDRFLFWKLLKRDMLISASGRPALWRQVERQWTKESKLEETFYGHYKTVRERLFQLLRLHNPNFAGTPTDLLRTSQKLLDRFIFAFYCEDMGERMLFPPQFIRDHIKIRCNEEYYDTEGGEFWSFFQRLFRTMNSGGKLGQMTVPHINGGLFDDDPLIDSLSIPNHIFAAPGQGVNEASLEKDRSTLFYLSARYNYAAEGDARESLSLYTLGRIFEQSITELEYRAGELEGRESLAKLSQRKRDGVYYTPEVIVNYLVEETLGPWFANAQKRAGYPAEGEVGREAIAAYEAMLKRVRIVDPACGSGAFLISAFRRLLDERKAVAIALTQAGGGYKSDEDTLIAEILANNIYGVDLNPSSVEIAKLALWLHSARSSAPLSSLDHTVRCGNSLIGEDFWSLHEKTPELEGRINPFDWNEKFPEVYAQGGFDIVLGNPPYVKLQNMTKVYPEAVAYLQGNRGADTYVSAQTGNFDLYLPFIEMGLRLLAPHGRMAYIAPSLWTVNEYGAGLCALLNRTQQLDRWVDFKSHQVFKEAITYTALQFFTHDPNTHVRIAVKPGGETGDIDWDDERLPVPVEEFGPEGGWLMVTGEERRLIQRLRHDCLQLGDPNVCTQIFQGLITSADAIYHLRKISPGRYWCEPEGKNGFEVEIEDEVMKPLVSGAEAKRYEECSTNTYLLFPYERDERGLLRLIAFEKMQTSYSKAARHLLKFEDRLRKRESGAFDDLDWHRFGRNQNLDKQELAKLVVAQTVPSMRVCADFDGSNYLNNVRVNGILAAPRCDMAFVMGVLNGAVVDFVFRRTAKPKHGGWFEANKQFIAPMPVPRTDAQTQRELGQMARHLQELWTHRRDQQSAAEARLSILGRKRHGAGWLWPDLPKLTEMKAQAPKRLHDHERAEWAQLKLAELEEVRISSLQGVLDSDRKLTAHFIGGELQWMVKRCSEKSISTMPMAS